MVISPVDSSRDPGLRDALLVVTNRFDRDTDWVDRLGSMYPEWSVTRCDTYLTAVAEAATKPFRAILAAVDPALPQLANAVSGLREAAGRQTKLLLYCRPELEPFARDAARAGADDYLVLPLDGAELDAAIGYGRSAQRSRAGLSAAPSASMAELAQLADLLSHLTDRPRALIDRLAGLVRGALSAKGATVVVEGAVAIDGEVASQPVLSAALHGPDGVIGQINLAVRTEGAYGPGDVQKLEHYARIAGHLLSAASKHRRWVELSMTDETSGLANRRRLYERLDGILAQAAQEHFPVTVLLFDVDDFKSYNDRFGHDAGDRIIRLVGELFQKQCRDQDVVARFGGDEFAVVFWDPEGPRVPGSRHPESALAVLDRVLEALRRQDLSSFAGGEGQLTISGGLATFPWDAAQRNDLLRRADEALLSAKRAGKNRIFVIGQS